ncbi:MAG: HD domain-containing protein [Candidatus Thermoplasmatota archaeon]|nr:HD domain-containing protein [Candidatus Thermoplasmatota archaeon]
MSKTKDVKDIIIGLLKGTGRAGIDELIKWLEENGFFKSPASTKFHSAYPGGLAKHSLGVYELLSRYQNKFDLGKASAPGQQPLPMDENTIVIAALLHDVCKVGAYLGSEAPYQWNKSQPKGHALLSIERIEKFIKLTDLEKLMIKYHMGPYGCNEFYDKDDWQQGEYPLRGDHSEDENLSKEESKKRRYGNSMANAWYHNPIVKLMYFCDELATLEEKSESEV